MSSLVLLETERLRLSGWRADQVDDLLQLHGDPEISRYLTLGGEPWSRDQATEAITSWIALFESQKLGKLRAERKSDGVLVGRAGYSIYPPTGEPELGFALFREHQGHGYATEAAAALRDWLFEATYYDHFIGFADTRNSASLAVLTRIGMERTHVEVFPDGVPCQFHILRKADWHGR